MQDIISTLKKNEKDVCVTIVISGKPKSFDDKEKALVKLRTSIAGAKKILDNYDQETKKALMDVLHAQLEQIDFRTATDSLVFYATKGFGMSVWLPFPEKEAVTVLNRFDIEPLLHCMALTRKYWALALSKNKTRLLKGENNHLTEIVDDNFPLAYEEQFEYEKQHYSLSHKKGSYSPDDSKVVIARFQGYIRHIDHLLANYIKNDEMPLILLGVAHNISDFIHTSSFANRIVNRIEGNFDHHSAVQIAQKVWTSSEKILASIAVQNYDKQTQNPSPKTLAHEQVTFKNSRIHQ